MKLLISVLLFCFFSLAPVTISAQDVANWTGRIAFEVGGQGYAVERLPRFEEYPATSGTPDVVAADIDWSGHGQAREYRTRLRAGLKAGADFNGRYRLVSHGCGSSCQRNWVIDTGTGRVLGDFYTSAGTLYHRDSALLIADPPPQDLEFKDINDVTALHGRKVTFYVVEKGQLDILRELDVTEALREQMVKR